MPLSNERWAAGGGESCGCVVQPGLVMTSMVTEDAELNRRCGECNPSIDQLLMQLVSRFWVRLRRLGRFISPSVGCISAAAYRFDSGLNGGHGGTGKPAAAFAQWPRPGSAISNALHAFPNATSDTPY